MRQLLGRFVFGRGPHRKSAGKALAVYDRIGEAIAVAKDPWGALAFGCDAVRTYYKKARQERRDRKEMPAHDRDQGK